jgi:hypothetical protein
LTAKFAWQRIPLEVKKKSAVLPLLWTLLVPLLQRDSALFFQSFAAMPAAPPLSALLSSLLTSLHAHVRASTIRRLEDAYDTIAVEEARRQLGMTGTAGQQDWEQEMLQGRGWLVEHDWAVVTRREKDRQSTVGEHELHQLTKYVLQLEQ